MPKSAKKKTPLPVDVVWWLAQGQHPLIKALGRVVRRLRDEVRGWSLRDLAEVTQLSISSLSDLENGQVSTSIDVILRLEAAFEMVEDGLIRLAHRELAANG